MNKEFLHMQKLAGLITESEYKQKMNEVTKLSPEEQKVADDILKAGMLEEGKFDIKKILTALVNKGKKGVLTLAIISSVLASCGVQPKDIEQSQNSDLKKQYELAVKLAKEDSAYAASKGNTAFNTDSATSAHYFSMQDRK